MHEESGTYLAIVVVAISTPISATFNAPVPAGIHGIKSVPIVIKRGIEYLSPTIKGGHGSWPTSTIDHPAVQIEYTLPPSS